MLDKDEPKVLVVVGAGVSAGATSVSYGSWLGLLKHGVQHLVDTGVFTPKHGNALNVSLDSSFSPFDLKNALQHAELVEQNLMTPDEGAFGRWLEAAFDEAKFYAKRVETLSALRELQQAGALLLTTNYDSLLSRATGLPPVTWEEHSDFLRVMNRQRSAILHIHGHWQRPSSVVLGRTSYNRIAQDQEFQAAFKSLWLGWSWVYVGCGDGL
jgi:NAD-dependent SIR2 family protein deacetylase